MPSSNYISEILSDKSRSDNFYSGLRGDNEQKYVDSLYEKLKSSIKFRLPNGGCLLGLDKKKTHLHLKEYNRLPYTLTAIEYYIPPDISYEQVHDDRMRGLNVDSRERVILCEQIDDSSVFMCLFTKAIGFWQIFEAAISINPLSGKVLFIPTFRHSIIYQAMTVREYEDHIIANYTDEVFVLADFLTALSCKNVSTTENAPPKYINKKREKKNKPPFFTSKTLTINIIGAEGSGFKCGSHASPRVHLRRGHIRRLPKGNVWVNAAVVGDKSKGMVVKDYKIQH